MTIMNRPETGIFNSQRAFSAASMALSSRLILCGLTTLCLSSALASNAQSVKQAQVPQKTIAQQMDSLGQNAELMNLARSLDPQNRALVVQERIIDRHNALELGVSFGAVAGGDAYFRTQNIGAQLEYHFSPRWSIGARYQDHGSKLTPEGERVFAEARKAYADGNRLAIFPDIDTPQSSYFASLSWYPLYGKLNWFDKAVSHFDLYLIGGAGQMVLSSGPTSLMTAGGGVGFWFRSGFSTRIELRSQLYQDKDQIYLSSRSLNTTVGQVGVGYVF
jgi:outer membrane beta-barrel protein